MILPTKICLGIALLAILIPTARCEMMPPPSQTAKPLNGKVVDARNHKPVAYPVISVIWTLKFKGDIAAEGQSMPLPEGQSALTKVEQDYGNSAGEFHVQGLSPFGFDWKVIPGQFIYVWLLRSVFFFTGKEIHPAAIFQYL